LSIGRVELESFIIGIFGTDQVAYAMLCSSLSAPALCPVGLEVGGLIGVV
jgi:hypothetical protein